MAQAAEIAGYKSPTFLHKAARAGRLRTTRHERSGVRLTTRAWLQAFLDGRDMRASSTRRRLPEGQEGEGVRGSATGGEGDGDGVAHDPRRREARGVRHRVDPLCRRESRPAADADGGCRPLPHDPGLGR